jgi:hypothetical protein
MEHLFRHLKTLKKHVNFWELFKHHKENEYLILYIIWDIQFIFHLKPCVCSPSTCLYVKLKIDKFRYLV